jgi:hypothetical protein
MIQVSLVGFMVGGAFLALAYFDYFYHLMALALVVHYLVKVSPPRPVSLAPSETGRPMPSRGG